MNDEVPLLKLPQNTCAYERYNPNTLEPENKETYVRLQELGWAAQDFGGRSVLDIGCNSGLLTIHALGLGAATVHATDVQPLLVEFVSSVVLARRLPVKVEQIAFDKLEPSKHKADIVLFMEVLHWAVAQGMDLRSVIQRLAGLTEHLLYIEFPWSVKEPSIQKQTKLTEETYSADAALDELTRHFSDVRIVRFMRYFGFESPSKRILIEARGKRSETSILTQLPGTYSLDVALSHGRNESYLLASVDGPLVAKLLAPESPMTLLPVDLCNQMFEEMNSCRPRTLVAPRKCQDKYLLPAPAGRYWMLFPFVGRLPSAGKAKRYPTDFDSLIDLFIKVRRDLRPFSPKLRTTLREHRLFVNVGPILSASVWRTDSSQLHEFSNEMETSLADLVTLDPEKFDALCHGDLQTGNVILDENEQPKVIDLDNLCVGTIYSDGLTGLIWRGATAETLGSFCENLGREETRSVARYDVHLAIANGVAWFSSAIRSKPNPVVDQQIALLWAGLRQAIQFAADIITAR
jgi:SAM-dependent methyltransferase